MTGRPASFAIVHGDAATVVDLTTPVPHEQLTFQATIVEVHDGDTFRADLYVGLAGIWLRDRRIRLAGCNAAELHEPGGVPALGALVALLPPGSAALVRVVSEVADPHGRLLATVRNTNGVDVVDQLIADGWAAPWNGHGPAPVPAWPRLPADTLPKPGEEQFHPDPPPGRPGRRARPRMRPPPSVLYGP
jgi:endonuclease YncB( thermonuclease family)